MRLSASKGGHGEAGRLRMGMKGQRIDKKKKQGSENLFFVKAPCALFSRTEWTEERAEAPWREKREREKKSSYFCNCFFLFFLPVLREKRWGKF